LRDVHGFRGGRFGLDAEQAREVFPEDQIQLIGIEDRVLTILPISKSNGNVGWSEVKKKVCVPFYRTQSPARLAKWESQSPGFRTFRQKFVSS
jgi:hypothetical protein